MPTYIYRLAQWLSKASKSFFRYNVLHMVSETVKDLLLTETELLVWANQLKTTIK